MTPNLSPNKAENAANWTIKGISKVEWIQTWTFLEMNSTAFRFSSWTFRSWAKMSSEETVSIVMDEQRDFSHSDFKSTMLYLSASAKSFLKGNEKLAFSRKFFKNEASLQRNQSTRMAPWATLSLGNTNDKQFFCRKVAVRRHISDVGSLKTKLMGTLKVRSTQLGEHES